MEASDATDLLSQLRPVQVPEAPGWWPPAPGWWILALLVLFLIGLFARWLHKRLQPDWRSSAIAVHRRLMEMPAETPAQRQQVVSELSVLMRRVALANRPRQQVASLVDEKWLSVLQQLSGSSQYHKGVGQLLSRGPYSRATIDSDQLKSLLALTGTTIRQAQEVASD